MRQEHDIQAEFSRIFVVEHLGEDEEVQEIEATAAERAALAERFGLLKLDSLAATVRLKRMRGGAVRVRGGFEAEVVQSCVVTLAPVASHLAERFSLVYSPDVTVAGVGEVEVSLDEEEAPEPLVGGAIDIGETVAQCLALALDPYPRAPGARLAGRYGARPPGRKAETGEEGPFAALAALKKKVKH